MLKKIFSFLLILLLSFLFISCYGNSNQLTTTNNASTNETTTTNTTNTEYTNIEITDNSKRFYYIDETFDKSTIELTAYYSNNTTEIIQSELFSVRDFDSTKPGRKTIFITFDSFITETEIIILEDYAFEIDMPYYEDAINLKGNLLHITLNNIINENFIPLLYQQAIEILEISDQDPDNPDNVIVAYPGDYGISVPTGYSSEINGYYWNREHVWPQSRLGVGVSYTNDFPSKATDVHNLKPSDPDENSARSNDYFDYFNTNNTYEPRDEVKGDIARILFYMATMYFDLTLDNDIYSESSEKTMGILSVLLEWNELDPVDDFERKRNVVIYSYQGNRNPFIDYPEFANLIWGDYSE